MFRHLISIHLYLYNLYKGGGEVSHIEIKLEEYLKTNGISKNKVCENCGLQRTQLNNYCKNKVSRVDLTILAKLCDYLGCSVSDLIEYKATKNL